MALIDTNNTLKKLKSCYDERYKKLFESYLVELEFTTILTYYSGSCALVIDITSVSEAKSSTSLCLMLDCNEAELIDLDDEGMKNIFENKILNNHKNLLELNKQLCGTPITRKVVIKNNNFNDAILDIRMDKDILYLNMNYNKIEIALKKDLDLIHGMNVLNIHMEMIINKG